MTLFIKDLESKLEDILRSKDVKFRSFIPDFSLRVCENVQILRIRRNHWLAAIRATFFENKQKLDGDSQIRNQDGQEIDILAQELERANHIDRIEKNTRIPNTRNNKFRDRAKSLTPIMDLESIRKVQELFSSRSRSRSILDHADKIPSQSLTTTNGNTQSLSVKNSNHVSHTE